MSVLDYFIQTSGSRICPISEIRPREPADSERLARALQKMALARSGIIPKRLPIRVISVSGGGYRVVDGNTTYHALVALGEPDGVVEMVEDR